MVNENIKLELDTLTIAVTNLVEAIVEQKLKDNVVEIVTSIQENYKVDNTAIDNALENFLQSDELDEKIGDIARDKISLATIEIY